MSVTVKVNGTQNSLVHKGSMGMAKCTAPDVCKTPSPGGPVPIPYPVIISMSSDLAKGTTTVKADGGNMCAIKGSEFSRCSGDEPGTAGGVKSSTNMKEATWILYSFDVKMDGKNACRKTDKMFMNHENTFCMDGEDQPPKKVQQPLNIDCSEKAKRSPPWEKCDFEQVCQMVKAFNESTQAKKKMPYSPRKRATPAQIPDAAERAAQHTTAAGYSSSIRNFANDFKALVEKKKLANPTGYMDDPEIASKFNTDCERDRWKAKGGSSTPARSPRATGVNPDHQHPAALGGDMATTPLKWANAEVNQTVGPAMDGHDPAKYPDGMVAHSSCNCT